MTVTTFSELELDESLLNALESKGFTRPTAIQAAAIPPALEGRDVLGSAPTGTGKTAAYLLPVLQHLLDFPRKKSGPPRILILTPTRELAMQVADHARELAANTHLDIATITGGVAYMNHAEVFSENQDIVVATTGRLLQYIKEENFDCRAVETLILDEADRMLDMGFAQDIEHIAGETRWRNQTMLFSATLEGEAIKDFAERLLEDPVEVSATPSTRERKKIHQWYYRADNLEHKVELLKHLLKQEDALRTIVFVRKRERVHELAEMLRTRLLGKRERELTMVFESFGFKHGIPIDADYVFDVRFLPNPHWDPKLRPMTGLDKPVAAFLDRHTEVHNFIYQTRSYLELWLPMLETNNRSYLTVAIRCTGGKHRSVYIAEQLADYFRPRGKNVQSRHRTLEKRKT